MSRVLNMVQRDGLPSSVICTQLVFQCTGVTTHTFQKRIVSELSLAINSHDDTVIINAGFRQYNQNNAFLGVLLTILFYGLGHNMKSLVRLYVLSIEQRLAFIGCVYVRN